MASKLQGDGTGATILRLRPDGPDPHARIVLAQLPPFRIGPVTVEPARLRLARAEGREEKLQPRIMQVLVALARAEGGIVTRDALTDSCWDGRIVGEDAISRAIAKVRRLADGIGAGAFAIETVSKVGYRLSRADAPARPPAEPAEAARAGPSRRALIGGLAAAGLAALGGAWLLGRGGEPAEPARPAPPEATRLFEQALIALRRNLPEADREAIGLLRRAVALEPRFADAWGLLALAYSNAFWGSDARRGEGAPELARSAAARARALDPNNSYAALAGIWSQPLMGTWLEHERVARAVAAAHRDNEFAFMALAYTLTLVGRFGDAAAPIQRVLQLAPAAPIGHVLAITTYWAANRLEEADSVLDRAFELFPGFPPLWIRRFQLYLFTGRAARAVDFASRPELRPAGAPSILFDHALAIARAIDHPTPAAVEAAMRIAMAEARTGVAFCENALQYACAFGRIDDAFAAAEALYFGRGFDPGELMLGPEQQVYVRRNDRRTNMLFYPSTAPMRADPRFAGLVERLGLERYWRDSGAVPDFRR